jgi:hypothetical protein
MRRSALESAFPNLRASVYRITSPSSPSYNCIAWAAGDDQSWWEPIPHLKGVYWPPDAPMSLSLESYVRAFECQAYELCVEGALEAGYEKVAIYVGADGLPTHAARQLSSGRWTSKLGKAEDIEHASPAALEGAVYGTVARVLKRRYEPVP